MIRALRNEATIQALLAVGAAAAFFLAWPTSVVWDDSGFVLRYLDNFAAGHFYCFNPADGPMFGVSSFLHGLLCGGLAWTRLLSPAASMFAINFLGLVALSFFSLRLLARVGGPRPLQYAGWLLLLSACPHLVINLKQGLETPLHVAIVVAALAALAEGRSPATWACCALAIVSKLDAAPAVAAIGAFALGRPLLARDSGATRRTLRDLAVWFLLPAVVYLAATTLIFGSPLPQSAFAKIRYHAHPRDSWFPFLTGFRDLQPFFVAGCALLALHLGLRLGARRRIDAAMFAPLFCGLAVLVGFWFYNPGERMGWYYALSEFLFVLQIVLVVLATSRELGRRAVFGGLVVVAGLGALSIPVTLSHVRHTLWYIRSCETERTAVGERVRAEAAPGDTLLTAFGLVSQAARIYAVDASGLNSRAATARGLDFNRLMLDLRPQWIVHPGLLYEDVQQPCGYALEASWYNFSGLVGVSGYRLYRRAGGDTLLVNTPVPGERIRTDGAVEPRGADGAVAVRGTRIRLELSTRLGSPRDLLVGLLKSDDALDLEAELLGPADAPLGRTDIRLEARSPAAGHAGYTDEWQLPLPAAGDAHAVIISARAAGTQTPREVVLLEPVVLSRALRSTVPPLIPSPVSYGEGWGAAEPWGRWALARRADLLVYPRTRPSRLVLRVAAAEAGGPPRRCVVMVEGRRETEFTVAGAPWQWVEQSVPVPAAGNRPLRVSLRFEALRPVLPSDPLPRALPFASIRLEPAP